MNRMHTALLTFVLLLASAFAHLAFHAPQVGAALGVLGWLAFWATMVGNFSGDPR